MDHDLTPDERRDEVERQELIAKARQMAGFARLAHPVERVPRPLLDNLVAGRVDFADVEDTDLASTDDELEAMTPIAPEKAEALKAARYPGQRGPQKAPTKEQVTLRLDRDVLSELRKDGPGWQPRANALLRKALGLE